jgi:hypothetical protein
MRNASSLQKRRATEIELLLSVHVRVKLGPAVLE